jgi:hypothetical protein
MPMRPGGMPPEERHSLDRHLRMSPLLGNRVTPVPAQLRRGPRWFARLGARETWLSTGNLRPRGQRHRGHPDRPAGAVLPPTWKV